MESLEDLSGARVLVTGGAGFIGTAVRDVLKRVGAHATLLDNLSAYEPATLALLGTGPGDPDLIYGDVCDEKLVRSLVDEADYVVHAAAHSTVGGCAADPATAFHSNMQATDTILRAVAQCGEVRHFVLLSTAQVYGNGAPELDPSDLRVFREEQPLRPLNLYASAKAWAEWHTRQLLEPTGRNYSILRPFSVYGPGQVPKPAAPSWVIAQFTMYAAIGQSLPLNNGGRQMRDFVYVEDVAEATVRALITPGAVGKTLNLGTGQATAVRTVAENVLALFPDTELIDTPRAAQDPLGGRAEITAMHTALEWHPTVTVAEGIARYASWVNDTPTAVPRWLREETTESRVAAWTGVPGSPTGHRQAAAPDQRSKRP